MDPPRNVVVEVDLLVSKVAVAGGGDACALFVLVLVLVLVPPPLVQAGPNGPLQGDVGEHCAPPTQARAAASPIRARDDGSIRLRRRFVIMAGMM